MSNTGIFVLLIHGKFSLIKIIFVKEVIKILAYKLDVKIQGI